VIKACSAMKEKTGKEEYILVKENLWSLLNA